MELLELPTRTVALGLFWQPRESKTLKVEARELASQMARGADARQFNFVALRPQHQEYGLAEFAGTRLPGKILALAGVLADQVSGKWAGHYALPDGGHWVACVIDGQILADGDVVLPEPAAARALLAQWQDSYSGLQVESYESVEDAQAVLATAVSKARAPVLIPLSGAGLAQSGVGFWGALGATAALCVLVLTWVVRHSGASEPRAVTPASSGAPRPRPPDIPPPPARAAASQPERAVAPTALAQGCIGAYVREPVSVAGWWTTLWLCKAEGTLRVTWRRNADGSFLKVPPGARIEVADPNQAIQVRALELPPRHATAIAPRAQAAASLYELARLFDLRLSISWPQAAPLPRGVSVPGRDVAPQAFDASEFHLVTDSESGAPEPELFEALAGVPGLVLRSIAWREEGRQWSYDGVLYTGETPGPAPVSLQLSEVQVAMWCVHRSACVRIERQVRRVGWVMALLAPAAASAVNAPPGSDPPADAAAVAFADPAPVSRPSSVSAPDAVLSGAQTPSGAAPHRPLSNMTSPRAGVLSTSSSASALQANIASPTLAPATGASASNSAPPPTPGSADSATAPARIAMPADPNRAAGCEWGAAGAPQGERSRLESEKQLLTLRLDIAALHRKLEELESPARPSANALPAAPVELPPVVLSRHGFDGHFGATLRLGSGGKLTVRAGDKLPLGTVEVIDAHGVTVSWNGHRVRLLDAPPEETGASASKGALDLTLPPVPAAVSAR